jgi:prolipoprotein diacylglyceryl transferase
MNADLTQTAIWNIDPVLLHLAGRPIRIYSLCFLLVFVLGYPLWQWQMRRGGHALRPISRIVPWALAGVVIGGRIGHCLLYEPAHYLSHPLDILDLRRGGIASHGSALGLVVSLGVYARLQGYSFLEVSDRFAMPAMLGAALVRIGNFFNSEIVGREWPGPWALRFPRFAARSQQEWEASHGPLSWTASALPRHPAQLYEAAGALTVLAVVYAIDRRLGEGRPRGLLTGACMTLYFSFRLLVEQWKEFQRFGRLEPDPIAQVIHVLPDAGLTLGQWLSFPFIAVFAALWIRSWRARLPAAQLSAADDQPG